MIQHVLLENRLLLFEAWVLLQFVLIAVWSWRRTRAANRAVWIALIVLPVLLLLSTLIVTQREQITSLCRTLARHVERGEAQPITDRLADQFEAADLDRDAFVKRLEPALTRYGISNIRLSRFDFSFTGDSEATVELSATCNVRTADAFRSRVPSRWRLELIRQDGDWYLISIEAIPTPLSPVRNIRDWIR